MCGGGCYNMKRRICTEISADYNVAKSFISGGLEGGGDVESLLPIHLCRTISVVHLNSDK